MAVLQAEMSDDEGHSDDGMDDDADADGMLVRPTAADIALYSPTGLARFSPMYLEPA